VNLFAVGDLNVKEWAVIECAICGLTRKLLGTTDLYTPNRTADGCPVIFFPPSREKRLLAFFFFFFQISVRLTVYTSATPSAQISAKFYIKNFMKICR